MSVVFFRAFRVATLAYGHAKGNLDGKSADQVAPALFFQVVTLNAKGISPEFSRCPAMAQLPKKPLIVGAEASRRCILEHFQIMHGCHPMSIRPFLTALPSRVTV